MSDVLEELAAEEDGRIDRRHVERRLRDWTGRIDDLYSDVEGWLPSGFSTERDQSVPMLEDLMSRYDIPAVQLPVLTILRHAQWFGKIVPRALWIIGANGRLDLFSDAGHHIIADRADNFETPKWMIAGSDNRGSQQAFSRASFLRAIGQ